MPGANYMGGKRNAAKARAKDSAGRIQKVFFGRRRLDLLSKGISRESSYNQFYADGKGRNLTSLDLAHSKQTTGHDVSSFIPIPTRFPPSTPRTRKSGSRIRQQCSSGSNSSQRSKVIDALDTSDPISLRATMDRILSLPDLAGLSAFEFRTPSGRSHRTPQGTKRPRRSEEWEPSSGGGYKRQKKMCSSEESEPRIRTVGKQNRLASQSSISSGSISDKIQERAYTSSSRSRSGVRRDADLRNSPQSYWGDDSGLEQDDDTSYPDFETGLEEYSNELHDGMQSPAPEDASHHRPQSSSSSIVHSESPGSIFWPENYSVRSQSVSSRSGTSRKNPSAGHGQVISSQYGNDATDAFDDLSMVSPDAHQQPFSSNNLYEHEDPWHTIGVILGLSPISQGKSYTHGHEQTSSASHSPKSWQNKQEHKPSSSGADGYLASELGLSAYSSSSRGSSFSISRGRLNLVEEDGNLLCSPFEALPHRQAQLNLTHGRSPEKTTPEFDHSPSSSVRSFSSRPGSEDQRVEMTCDIEKPELPRFEGFPSASDTNSLVLSSVHAPSERSNLLSPALGNTSDVPRPLILDHAKATPTPTGALTDSMDMSKAWNDYNGDIRCSELRMEDSKPKNCVTYDTPLFAAGTDGRSTTAPLKELFASFEMCFEKVDGVFRGPCLFGEDGSDL